MSESTPEAPAEQAAQPAPEKPAPPAEDPKSTDDTDWKAEARKWEQRAKDNKAAAAELEKQRKASMTEAERAVVEAKAAGAAEASKRFGERLARSEFLAAAARRNPKHDTAEILEDLNLSRLIGEDGDPDPKAIEAAVARLVPAPQGPPSFDGGARKSADAPFDMNKLMRDALGRS